MKCLATVTRCSTRCLLFSTSSSSSVHRVFDAERCRVSVPQSTEQLGRRQVADVLPDEADEQQTVAAEVVDDEAVDVPPVATFQLDGLELATNVRRLSNNRKRSLFTLDSQSCSHSH